MLSIEVLYIRCSVTKKPFNTSSQSILYFPKTKGPDTLRHPQEAFFSNHRFQTKAWLFIFFSFFSRRSFHSCVSYKSACGQICLVTTLSPVQSVPSYHRFSHRSPGCPPQPPPTSLFAPGSESTHNPGSRSHPKDKHEHEHEHKQSNNQVSYSLPIGTQLNRTRKSKTWHTVTASTKTWNNYCTEFQTTKKWVFEKSRSFSMKPFKDPFSHELNLP